MDNIELDAKSVKYWLSCTPICEQYSGPNSTKIYMNGLTIYYSYSTVVAFWGELHGRQIAKNTWSVTTGKHLNDIDPDHSIRLDYDQFANLLAEELCRVFGGGDGEAA